MTDGLPIKATRIRELNDQLRCKGTGGRIVITRGIEALGTDGIRQVLAAVAGFDAFTEDNDPYKEHDFGSIDEGGIRCFWKLDYFDRTTEFGSPDPADLSVTTRVLTVMLADEY